MTKLSFLTVNYNSSDLITRFILSLPPEINYQMVIVNNSAADQNLYQLKQDFISIIESEDNIGFGQACNLGLNWIYEQDSRAIVWLINPDAYFKQDFVAKAISFFHNYPQLSLLGTAVCNSDDEITSAGGEFIYGKAALSTITAFPPDSDQDYFATAWVSGCSLLVNLANFNECPLFCDRYFLYYEDLDFCLRYGQEGHKIAVTPLLKVFHDTSSISDRNITWKYQHITHSYLIHVEKYGTAKVFWLTNFRMLFNTLRLLLIKPNQGWGKLIGFYNYWHIRLWKV